MGIGPNVYFSNPVAVIANSKKMVYTFCNPDGYKGVARSDFTLANNINLYTLPAGTQVNGVDTYAKTVFGGATKDMTTITNGDADTQEGVNVRHVWDPVMAAPLCTTVRMVLAVPSRTSQPRALLWTQLLASQQPQRGRLAPAYCLPLCLPFLVET